MTRVIIDFETQEQAEKFFGLFDDRGYGLDDEAIPKAEKAKQIINDAMTFCGIDVVNTKEENDYYHIELLAYEKDVIE